MSSQSTTPEGTTPDVSTRRELLRRAGFVAGAGTLAWAAPTITTLGSAAFAVGTEGTAFASVLTEGCGLATSTQENDGPYSGLYSQFTATFPGAPAGVPVERVVLLNGTPHDAPPPEPRNTDANGVATGFSNVQAGIRPGTYTQGTVTFTIQDGTKRSVTVVINFTQDCAG